MKSLGISEVQIHEPALVLGDANNWKEHYQAVYKSLSGVKIPLNLVTYFDDLGETYSWVMDLPVNAISLDLTRGGNLELIKTYGFPKDKRLGVGIVDARNIWQIRPEEVIPKLETIKDIVREFEMQPSASLQYVPYDATRETQLPEALGNVFSFAEQKLKELVCLAQKITVCDAKCNHEPLVNFNRNNGQNKSKIDVTKLTVTRKMK